MPFETCPLLLTSKSREAAKCIKDECMWFYKLPDAPKGRGKCYVHRLVFELSQINSNMNSLTKAMYKK